MSHLPLSLCVTNSGQFSHLFLEDFSNLILNLKNLERSSDNAQNERERKCTEYG